MWGASLYPTANKSPAYLIFEKVHMDSLLMLLIKNREELHFMVEMFPLKDFSPLCSLQKKKKIKEIYESKKLWEKSLFYFDI